jgi:hypothetical protein
MLSFRTTKRCFCAFCRSPRLVYVKKHVSLLDIALSVAAALLVSFIVFQDFDPRAVVFFAVGLGVTEMFIIFRWRLSIACPHCGFDPVTYKKMPDRALTRVKAHLKERREDPLSAFSTPIKLPQLRRPPATERAGPPRPPVGL